ncbi:MAG: FAD-dependent thymidylate synthase [Patescibacteria group bacterium]|nr:FAD-dependent thymidylate synthase [Patescibacteria group bacterium]MDE2439028.1 FAD-dependent thymidylate synthase [Patescibacteria group bacterium]
MQFVRPEIFHVAATYVDQEEMEQYLQALEAPWSTDAANTAEQLIEVAGRLCYRSFKPGLNKNVSKVREGNQPYLTNILNSKHGSVLEHGSDSYIFFNVSRVFTHEVVRHRAGCSYSQESLRYVRLDELRCSYPRVFERIEDEKKREHIKNLWIKHFESCEALQLELAQTLDLDLDNKTFEEKKKLTSAMRRLAPMGLATSILMTANHRVWRHLIQLRTSRYAEEEIRMVFAQVFEEQKKCYPNIYQDAILQEVDGIPEIIFKNEKV